MKRSTGIILFLLLLAFTLRVWSLSVQSIWWDEAFTWQTTSHGFASFWQMLLTGDRNPPLYFVTVALWGSAAGWSEFSLRFVSVAWSLIGLAFLFNLTKRMYNTSAGLWTLALAAFSPALVVYAQEARMYAAFFTLTAATLYFARRVFEIGNQPLTINNQKWIGLFLGCEAALLLTHYFALPIVIAINVCALVRLTLRRAQFAQYAKWIGGQILAALPIVLWMLIVFATPGSLTSAKEPPPNLLAFIYQAGILWLTGVRDLDVAHGHLAPPALGLMVLAAIGAWRANSRSTRGALAFGMISLVLAFALTSVLTSFHPRYLLPYSIFLFVLAGGALSNLRFDRAPQSVQRRRASLIGDWAAGGLTLLFALLLMMSGWQSATSPAYAKDDARSVAAYLKNYAAANDVIVLEANDHTLDYYDHGLAQTKMITATTETEAFQQLSAAVGSAKQVWLPHWVVSTQDPRGYWRFLFEQAGGLKDWTSYQGYELYGYEMQSALHKPAIDQVAPPTKNADYFEAWSGMDGMDGALAFAVQWLHGNRIYNAVSMRLLDMNGVPLSSVDVRLQDETGAPAWQMSLGHPNVNYYILPIPPGTPPLTYTLVAHMYAIESLGSPNSASEGTVLNANQQLGIVHLPRRLDTSDPYRTLAGYNWQGPTNQRIVPGLTLEAYAVSPQSLSKPMPIDVTLRWRKAGETGKSTPRLRLAQADRVWSEIGSNLLERDYPIELWQNGETVIDRLQIDYPPVRGPIELQVGQGDHWTTLTTLQLDESQLMFNPPTMQHAQAAQFGSLAELLGHDLKSDSLSSSRPLHLTLYWRALNTEPITTPYTVFTQILAPDGHLVAQHDAPPNPPTTQWVPGQIVLDSHAIKTVDPAYRGPATLIVGWYNSASIERVPVQGGGDFVTLAVPVRVEDQ